MTASLVPTSTSWSCRLTLPGTRLNYGKSPLHRALVSVGLSGHGFAHRGLLGAALCRSSWEGLNSSPRLPQVQFRTSSYSGKRGCVWSFLISDIDTLLGLPISRALTSPQLWLAVCSLFIYKALYVCRTYSHLEFPLFRVW